jgi:hypothetical protein
MENVNNTAFLKLEVFVEYVAKVNGKVEIVSKDYDIVFEWIKEWRSRHYDNSAVRMECRGGSRWVATVKSWK